MVRLRSRHRRLLAGAMVAGGVMFATADVRADLNPYQAGAGAFAGTITYAAGQGIDLLSSCASTGWSMSLLAAGVEVELASNEYAGPVSISVNQSDWCAQNGLSFPFGTVTITSTGPVGHLSCSHYADAIMVGTAFHMVSGGTCYINGSPTYVVFYYDGAIAPLGVSGSQISSGEVGGAMAMRGGMCPFDCYCIPEDCFPPPLPSLPVAPPTLRAEPGTVAVYGTSGP
jgi:hypothetical protein